MALHGSRLAANTQLSAQPHDGGHPGRSGTLLRVRNLGVEFRDPVTRRPSRAVGDVSFDVGRAKMVSLIGPSGCGKSTVISAIAGLIKYSHGEITGSSQTDGKPYQAIVFQRAALLPWRTALDNVAFPLTLRGMRREAARDRASAILDMVGLQRFHHHHPHQLSGGMQQRVNLARALVLEPTLLLLDEPFAALDALTRERLQEELLGIMSRTGLAGIFVTHQIDEAVLMGDSVVVMSHGPASTVRAVIDIDLPRPRPAVIRTDAQFLKLVGDVGKIVRNEVTASSEPTENAAE